MTAQAQRVLCKTQIQNELGDLLQSWEDQAPSMFAAIDRAETHLRLYFSLRQPNPIFRNIKAEAREAYCRACQLMLGGFYNKALPFLNSALSQEPGFLAAHIKLAHCQFSQNQYDEAASIYQQLLQSKGLPAAWQGDCQNGLAAIAFQRGQMTLARNGYEEAATIYEALGDAPRQFRVLSNLLIANVYEGRLEQAFGLSLQIESLAQKLGDLSSQAHAAHLKAGILLEQGRNEQALTVLDQNIYYAQKLGQVYDEANAHLNRAIILFELGNIKDSEAALKQAEMIWGDALPPREAGLIHLHKARLYSSRAEWEQAEAHLESAEPLFQSLEEPALWARWDRLMAQVAHAQKDEKRAFDHYERAKAKAEALPHSERLALEQEANAFMEGKAVH